MSLKSADRFAAICTSTLTSENRVFHICAVHAAITIRREARNLQRGGAFLEAGNNSKRT